MYSTISYIDIILYTCSRHSCRSLNFIVITTYLYIHNKYVSIGSHNPRIALSLCVPIVYLPTKYTYNPTCIEKMLIYQIVTHNGTAQRLMRKMRQLRSVNMDDTRRRRRRCRGTHYLFPAYSPLAATARFLTPNRILYHICAYKCTGI